MGRACGEGWERDRKEEMELTEGLKDERVGGKIKKLGCREGEKRRRYKEREEKSETEETRTKGRR